MLQKFEIKPFEQIEIKDVEEKLKVIESTIKPDMFTISKQDMDFVIETLGLETMTDKEQLRALRNEIVKYFQDKIVDIKDCQYKSYFGSKTQKYVTLTSAITHCVDLRVSDLGFMD